MTDHLTPQARSENMSRIRSADTSPERKVRSALHRMGFRFRLRRSDLAGRPDIVLHRHKQAVFVHGCFWHSHGCKRGGAGPKSNQEYWRPKLARNRARDRTNARILRQSGWKVLVIWECETQSEAGLQRRLRRLLAP